MEYKSNNSIVYSSKYHAVWGPKYQCKVLVGNIETRLKDLIKQTCLEIEADIIEIEIMPEHVHLLLEGKASRYLRKEFKLLTTKQPALWTNSYFVSTVGGAPFGKKEIF